MRPKLYCSISIVGNGGKGRINMISVDGGQVRFHINSLGHYNLSN